MKVPSWEEFNVWVLRVLSDGETRSLRELYREVPARMNLPEEYISVTLSSGQSTVANRIGWSASYLTRVDALDRPKRAHYRITGIGRKLLADNPERVSEAALRKLAKSDDRWWVTKPKVAEGIGTLNAVDEVDTKLDPIEQVEQGIARIHEEISQQLLTRLQV